MTSAPTASPTATERWNDLDALARAVADIGNTVGLPFYVKQWEREGGRGIVLHTQCNSLPLCHQPAALVKVYSSN